jgi:transposase
MVHLRRDFQAMIDRRNVGSAVGEDLLVHADILLSRWKRVRDGTLSRNGFRASYLGWIRVEVQALLRRGAGCGCAVTAGVCRELLKMGPALYTFAAVEGVEPTNNAAERALRHAVCWRKTSFGTDTASGSRFVERVLTVVAACRQQGRDVLHFLTDCCRAAAGGVEPPSLLPRPVHRSVARYRACDPIEGLCPGGMTWLRAIASIPASVRGALQGRITRIGGTTST